MMTPRVMKPVFALTAAMVLSACVGGTQTAVVEPATQDNRKFKVSSMYDKVNDIYYNTVSLSNAELNAYDRTDAVEALLAATGEKYCESGTMTVAGDDGAQAADGVQYIANNGTFMIASRCSKNVVKS